ncbi:MAG TPA: peptide ABC transporter substrate-binding protein [Candidatus Sulfotelmatobacter sp.]|nr:peptide ABC transporter substrate-binding protein [Candidatus Sulfotelmatobacter sp.]
MPAVRAPRLLAGLLLAVMLAGCVRAGGPAAAAGSARFAVAADPRTLDPLFAHTDANNVEQQLNRLAFEPFVDVDERGHPVPVLLTRIPSLANGDLSRDGRTITYRLRRNVRWQDGVEVTARDVVWTVHAILDNRNPVASRAGYERIASIQALDPWTVRVRLRSAWAPAVATLFGDGPSPQYVLPAHLLANVRDLATAGFGAQPVGDGPYRLVSWSRGERLVYAANPTYWRGRPAIARLEVDVVPDPGTNFTLLRSGGLDWNLLSPAQRASLGDAPGIAYRTVPLAMVVGLALQTRHAPLDDVRVRRAIAASIDRAGISRTITDGRYPVVDTAQPLGSWARDPSVREPGFDPAVADRLLDAAGWRRGSGGMRAKGGKPLALTYVQFPESQTGVRVAVVVQRELQARGIDLTIKSLSNAQLFLPKAEGGTLATGRFDLAYVPWPMGADPDDAFLLACDGFANYARWCDPQVDALERRAQVAPDRAERARLYGQIERRVADAVPIVFLFDPSYSYAYRTSLHGFFPNAFTPTWDAWRWRRTSS